MADASPALRPFPGRRAARRNCQAPDCVANMGSVTFTNWSCFLKGLLANPNIEFHKDPAQNGSEWLGHLIAAALLPCIPCDDGIEQISCSGPHILFGLPRSTHVVMLTDLLSSVWN